jgi:hypothetical protein
MLRPRIRRYLEVSTAALIRAAHVTSRAAQELKQGHLRHMSHQLQAVVLAISEEREVGGGTQRMSVLTRIPSLTRCR